MAHLHLCVPSPERLLSPAFLSDNDLPTPAGSFVLFLLPHHGNVGHIPSKRDKALRGRNEALMLCGCDPETLPPARVPRGTLCSVGHGSFWWARCPDLAVAQRQALTETLEHRSAADRGSRFLRVWAPRGWRWGSAKASGGVGTDVGHTASPGVTGLPGTGPEAKGEAAHIAGATRFKLLPS